MTSLRRNYNVSGAYIIKISRDTLVCHGKVGCVEFKTIMWNSLRTGLTVSLFHVSTAFLPALHNGYISE